MSVLGSLLGGGTSTYVILTVGAVLLPAQLKLSAAQLLLRGLKTYRLQYHTRAPSKASEEDRSLSEAARKAREAAAAARFAAVALEKCGLVTAPLTDAVVDLTTLASYDQFRTLVTFFTALALNLLMWEVSRALGLSENRLLPIICFMACLIAVLMIIAGVTDARVTTRDEMYAVAAGVFACQLAAMLTLFFSARVLDVGIMTVAKMLSISLDAWRNAALPHMRSFTHKLLTAAPLQPGYLLLLLSVVAGAAGGLVLLPALRATRCFLSITSPPAWAKEHLGAGGRTRLLLHLNLLLPPLCALSFVPPMVSAVPPAALGVLRPLLLLAAGALQAAALRPLMQGHIDQGFVLWYDLKHCAGGADPEKVLTTIKRRMSLGYVSMCKAAVHLAAPALLLAALGAALRALAARPLAFADVLAEADMLAEAAASAASAAAGTVGVPAAFPAKALLMAGQASLSFLAWWTCAIWSAVTVAGLAAAHFGVPLSLGTP